MIRAPWGDISYWNSRVNKFSGALAAEASILQTPSKNPRFRPQYWMLHCRDTYSLMMLHYSRGDSIHDLPQYFPGLLESWEESNRLAAELNAQLEPGQGWDHRHLLPVPRVSDDPRAHTDPRAWDFRLRNLNHYNWCFWLAGLALALEVPEAQWQRLLALVGGEGEDALLDRVIASRQPGRKIGAALLHPRPYRRLLKTIDAPVPKQPGLLRDFVAHWYAELERKGWRELWWYIYGDPVKHPLEMGSYFGRWCIEAAGAVKAFGLDDSLCLGHEHYPGDLLRPDGPSTHPAREAPGWLARLFGVRQK